MTDFCEALYHKNREPLHFFVDEAHTIAPQKVFPDGARLLGAMEDIVLQGRRRGIGTTVISQRPALVNKNIISQAHVLVAMRILGAHDREAISEWIDAFGDKEQGKIMLAGLASLARGEGWIWAPGWDLFRKVMFRRRETFDSSQTPEVGGAPLRPAKLAEIDVAALGAQIKATVKRVKDNDPRELRRRLADLERKLAERPAEEKIVERVEFPVLKDGQLNRTEKVIERTEALGQKLLAEAADLRRLVGQAVHRRDSSVPPTPPSQRPAPARSESPTAIPSRPAAIAGEPGRVPTSRAELNPSEAAVLDAAASFPSGATRQRISIYSGRSIKSSSFQKAFPALERAGLLECVGDKFKPTDAGRGLAQTSSAVTLEDWLRKLVPSEAKALRCLADASRAPYARTSVGADGPVDRQFVVPEGLPRPARP